MQVRIQCGTHHLSNLELSIWIEIHLNLCPQSRMNWNLKVSICSPIWPKIILFRITSTRQVSIISVALTTRWLPWTMLSLTRTIEVWKTTAYLKAVYRRKGAIRSEINCYRRHANRVHWIGRYRLCMTKCTASTKVPSFDLKNRILPKKEFTHPRKETCSQMEKWSLKREIHCCSLKLPEALTLVKAIVISQGHKPPVTWSFTDTKR